MELGLKQAPSVDGMELGLIKKSNVDLGLMKNMSVELGLMVKIEIWNNYLLIV